MFDDNNNDYLDDIAKSFERAYNNHDRLRSEFQKLSVDNVKIPNKGDKVLFAAGLIGHGFEWIRKEAIVIECADTAYKVRFKTILNEYKEEWIHHALITDILK